MGKLDKMVSKVKDNIELEGDDFILEEEEETIPPEISEEPKPLTLK